MIHIHARGNMSTAEKARLVFEIEREVLNSANSNPFTRSLEIRKAAVRIG